MYRDYSNEMQSHKNNLLFKNKIALFLVCIMSKNKNNID